MCIRRLLETLEAGSKLRPCPGLFTEASLDETAAVGKIK